MKKILLKGENSPCVSNKKKILLKGENSPCVSNKFSLFEQRLSTVHLKDSPWCKLCNNNMVT